MANHTLNDEGYRPFDFYKYVAAQTWFRFYKFLIFEVVIVFIYPLIIVISDVRVSGLGLLRSVSESVSPKDLFLFIMGLLCARLSDIIFARPTWPRSILILLTTGAVTFGAWVGTRLTANAILHPTYHPGRNWWLIALGYVIVSALLIYIVLAFQTKAEKSARRSPSPGD